MLILWCFFYLWLLGQRWPNKEVQTNKHNVRYSVANHQPHECLLNRLFGRRSKKTSKIRVTGLCAGNSPVTGEFPAQKASNAENVSIWWRTHDNVSKWYEVYHPLNFLCDGCHVWPICHVWRKSCVTDAKCYGCHVWPICHVWRMSCVTDVKCDGCHVWRMSLYTHSLAAVTSEYLGPVTNNQRHGAHFIFKSHKISFVHKSHFCLWIISKCCTKRHNMNMELEIKRDFGEGVVINIYSIPFHSIIYGVVKILRTILFHSVLFRVAIMLPIILFYSVLFHLKKLEDIYDAIKCMAKHAHVSRIEASQQND